MFCKFVLFLLAPLREGRPFLLCLRPVPWPFLLAPLREGRHGSAVPSGGGLVISTHAPTRGATELFAAAQWSIFYFYSRPYARGDLEVHHHERNLQRFLLTPLREGRPMRPVPRSSQGVISTHAPTRGATGIRGSTSGRPRFLLTPLREGQLTLRTAWRARSAISTHAPTRGATLARRWSVPVVSNFYSRPYARGNRNYLRRLSSQSFISTHAPTRGATAIFHKTIS